MKNFRPLVLFVALLLIVGMACSFSGGGSPTQQPPVQNPTAEPQQQSNQPEAPTAVVEEPTAAPTEAPAGQQYFTEEFDQDPGWDYFLTSGDKDKVTVEFKNSNAIFDLEDTNIYAYYLYEQYSYDNVRIDLRAENRGKNNNNVSLICRASDKGWYEFSTEGGGLWYLYAVTIKDKKAVYNRIDNGGASSLKQGKETNDYAMICDGNNISVIVNDKVLKKHEDKEYSIADGGVGFNISSLNVTPIIVNVDWFKISQP